MATFRIHYIVLDRNFSTTYYSIDFTKRMCQENTSMSRSLIPLFTLIATAAIIGCSVSSSPPTPELDRGVNWALSGFIDWNYKDKNLFDSYRIVNQYTEKRSDGVAYIYDFEADCLVHVVFHAGQSGESKGWAQALPKTDPRLNKFNGGDIHHFKGTFTLIQKGDAWYPVETVR